jgi:hypothetical protein
MLKLNTPFSSEQIELDRFYREGGLEVMALPHVHYDDPACPHAGCSHLMEWIDFKLELHGDPEGVYRPLVRSWWEGTGFAGRCPRCGGWIRFTTLGMHGLEESEIDPLPKLPENGASVAQFG